MMVFLIRISLKAHFINGVYNRNNNFKALFFVNGWVFLQGKKYTYIEQHSFAKHNIKFMYYFYSPFRVLWTIRNVLIHSWCCWKLLHTDPAEMRITCSTCHVVASAIFLNSSMAIGALFTFRGLLLPNLKTEIKSKCIVKSNLIYNKKKYDSQWA